MTRRTIKETVTNPGDWDGTVVYYYDGQRIIETRDGSGNLVQQFMPPLTHGVPRCGTRRAATIGLRRRLRVKGGRDAVY